jgi:hypothetical protein
LVPPSRISAQLLFARLLSKRRMPATATSFRAATRLNSQTRRKADTDVSLWKEAIFDKFVRGDKQGVLSMPDVLNT